MPKNTGDQVTAEEWNAATTAPQEYDRATGTDTIISGKQTTDTGPRWAIDAVGKITWSDGAGAVLSTLAHNPTASTGGHLYVDALSKVNVPGLHIINAGSGTGGLRISRPGNVVFDVRNQDQLAGTEISSTNRSLRYSASGSLTTYAHLFDSKVTTVPLVAMRGAASQTANLQEWQDSTGAVMAQVSSAGAFSTFHSVGGEVIRVNSDQNPVLGFRNIATIQSTNTVKLQYGSVFPVNGTIVEGIRVNSTGISFLGKTPTVTRQANIPDPTGGATIDAEARTAIAAIIDALEAYGLLTTI